MCSFKEKKFLGYEWKKYIGSYEWWYWLEEGLYKMGENDWDIFQDFLGWGVVEFSECVWVKPAFPNLTW